MNNSIKTIRIDDENIALEREYKQELILGSKFYNYIIKLDDAPYSLSEKSQEFLEILEISFALMDSLSVLYEQYLDSDDEYDESPYPEELLALHQASWYAAKKLDELSEYEVKVVNAFRLTEITDLLQVNKKLSEVILKDVYSYLKEYNPQDIDHTVEIICAYFHIMHKTVELIAKDTRFSYAEKQLKDYKFKILDMNFNYLAAPVIRQNEEPSISININEIIGNKEYIEAGEKLVRNLLAFDPGSGKNPRKFNHILFALGRPGSGKTATANAIGNVLIKRASQIGLEAKFVVIRRTDWASSYQNESASSLLERFTSQLEDFDGVVIFYWADIDTAFSSRSDDNSGSEENNILGAVFGLLDGTVLPVNGQWALMCDANYMKMDEALISRISAQPYSVNGPETVEDYVVLLRDILLGKEYEQSLDISKEEWEEIGTLLIKYDFSGRNLYHLSSRLSDKMEDFEYDNKFFELNFEDRKRYIRKHRNKINFEYIKSEIKKTKQFKEDAKKLENEEEVKRLIHKILVENQAFSILDKQSDDLEY